MRYRPLIFAILSYCSFLMLGGCSSGKEKDPRLIEIAATMADSPQRALARLDSINPTSLPEADRNYHGLLTVKARDKAYVTHTSDSLILSVIGYYSSHRRSGHYPEALYYGARVYSDIGDYPSSLRYFQTALDELPDDTDQLELRGYVLSQMGRLLNTLRLYEKAIICYKEALEIDSKLTDSINMMYDYGLLGSVYLNKMEFDSAEVNFKEAQKLAEMISPEEVCLQKAHIGGIKLNKGEYDSVITIFKPILNEFHTLDRSYALANISNAYAKLNKPDSAYIYARELVYGEGASNRRIGYEVLLSQELKNCIPQDSIYSYIIGLCKTIDWTLNDNEAKAALLQNSLYNYRLHEKARISAEKSKAKVLKCIIIAVLIILGLIIFILIQKNHNQRNIIQLREALDDLSTLRNILEDDKKNIKAPLKEENSYDSNNTDTTNIIETNIVEETKIIPYNNDESDNLVKKLKQELLDLQRISNHGNKVPSPELLKSSAYKKLETFIYKEKVITESNPLWNELETEIIKESKDFKYHLNLLTGGILKPQDYHIALLIKCGVSPTHMSALIGRTKGTISYRREKLCERVFGERLGVKTIDDVIRML